MEASVKTAFFLIFWMSVSCSDANFQKQSSHLTNCCLQECKDMMLVRAICDKYPNHHSDSNFVATHFIKNDSFLYSVYFENITVDTLPCEFYKLSDLYDLRISFVVKVTRFPDIPHFKSLKDVYYRGFDLSNTEVVIDERYSNVETLRMPLCNVTNIRFKGNFPKLRWLEFGNENGEKIQLDESLFKLDSLEHLAISGNLLGYDFSRLSNLKNLYLHDHKMTIEMQTEFVKQNNKVPYLRISNMRGVYYYEFGKLIEASEFER